MTGVYDRRHTAPSVHRVSGDREFRQSTPTAADTQSQSQEAASQATRVPS